MSDSPWRRALGRLTSIEASPRIQSLVISGGRVVSSLLAIAIPIVLVRVFDQSTFGVYKQLFLISSTAVMVLTVGLPASLYYFVPRSEGSGRQYHVQSALLLCVLGAVGAAALLAGRPLLERAMGASIGPFVAWIALFTGLSVPAALLPVSPMVDRRAHLAALFVAGFDVLKSITLVSVALVWRALTPVLVAACGIMALQVIVLGIYLVSVREARKEGFRTGRLRQQLAYALPFGLTALIGLARDQAHAYYVAAQFSSAQFAIYAVATLNIPFIGQLSRTVSEVVILENSEHFKDGRIGEMQRVWHRATHVLALMIFPIFMVGEVFAHEVVRMLFGPAYMEAVPILRVYLTLLPVSILLASPMLRATGDLGVMVLADIASLVTALAVLFLLAGPLGPIGAVTSLVAGKAVFAGLSSRRTAQRMEMGVRDFLRWGLLLRVLVLAALAAVGGWAATSWWPAPALVRFGLGASVALAIFALIAWNSRLLPPTEKELVLRLLRRRSGTREPSGDVASATGSDA